MNGPIDQGGYVYPVYVAQGSGKEVGTPGITRRDWLAGLAMSGLVTGTGSDKDSMHPKTALEVARAAYHIADLMIRQSKEEEALGAAVASTAI